MTSPPRRILYLQYTNPGGYPPLEHSTRILADEGWDVCLLGIALQPELRFPAHPRIQIALLPVVATGWRQKAHYFYYWIWVFWWVLRWRPQWIYASDPLSAPIGLSLSYLPRIKVIYHEHDSPSPNTLLSTFMRGVMWARRRLAQRVKVNILPNSKRGDYLQENSRTKRPIITVWNCPAKSEVPIPMPKSAQSLRLLYHGTIVPQRLPLAILEALAELPENVELHVVGYETQGSSGYSQTLLNCATQLGIQDRLQLHGTVATRTELLKHGATCHVGLAFMPLASDDMNLETMEGASNKPFDYMACGLALLVTPLAEWERLYVLTGYGIASDPTNHRALVNAIQWYLDHPTERQKMGEQGRQRVLKEWNYEQQFQPIIHLLTS